MYQYVEGSNDLSQAALLHDIGKTDSYLGAVGRSLATLWNGLGRPTNGRWQSYLDHGSSGALLLEDFGANRLAISFTRHHPGTCRRDVDLASWRSLEEADDA